MKKRKPNGYHKCFDRWAINNSNKYIPVKNLYPECDLRIISFDDIGYKKVVDVHCPRYQLADTRFPCLVAEGATNPEGKPFRLLDGRNRIFKSINDGHDSGIFFVISNQRFLEEYDKATDEMI